MLVMLLVAFNLQRSHVGLAFRAIRDNDIASSVLGVDSAALQDPGLLRRRGVRRRRRRALRVLHPLRHDRQFTIWLSVWYLGMLIVGGLERAARRDPRHARRHRAAGGHPLGRQPCDGGAAAALRAASIFAVTNVVLGATIIYMLIREPHGLAHRWSVLKTAYRIWPYPRG